MSTVTRHCENPRFNVKIECFLYALPRALLLCNIFVCILLNRFVYYFFFYFSLYSRINKITDHRHYKEMDTIKYIKKMLAGWLAGDGSVSEIVLMVMSKSKEWLLSYPIL
jgi:hypothetical protein